MHVQFYSDRNSGWLLYCTVLNPSALKRVVWRDIIVFNFSSVSCVSTGGNSTLVKFLTSTHLIISMLRESVFCQWPFPQPGPSFVATLPYFQLCYEIYTPNSAPGLSITHWENSDRSAQSGVFVDQINAVCYYRGLVIENSDSWLPANLET